MVLAEIQKSQSYGLRLQSMKRAFKRHRRVEESQFGRELASACQTNERVEILHQHTNSQLCNSDLTFQRNSRPYWRKSTSNHFLMHPSLLVAKHWGPPRGFVEQGIMITYFQVASGILGISVREQGIFLLLRWTLTKKLREQWNLLMGNKGEKVKFPRDQGNTPRPREVLTTWQSTEIDAKGSDLKTLSLLLSTCKLGPSQTSNFTWDKLNWAN